MISIEESYWLVDSNCKEFWSMKTMNESQYNQNIYIIKSFESNLSFKYFINK